MSRPNVVRVYPERASLTLYRHAVLQEFLCCRCGAEKKSKLAAVLEENFGALVCNGCYGWFLSCGEGDFTVFAKGKFTQVTEKIGIVVREAPKKPKQVSKLVVYIPKALSSLLRDPSPLIFICGSGAPSSQHDREFDFRNQKWT